MRLAFGLALLFGVARAVSAQDVRPVGQVEGTIGDSVRLGPIAGAVVGITRRGVEPEVTIIARSDEQGRFRFDSLEAGRYWLSFSSPFLDSLGYGGPARDLTVVPGQPTRVVLAGPSAATLRATACPGVALAKETGALYGRVIDADRDEPLIGAQVNVAWTQLTFDREVRRALVKQHSAGVKTDSLGEYRLCGVPTDSWLLVQVQSGEKLGSALQVMISESAGVQTQHLSFSADAARAPNVLLEALRDSATLAPLHGTAALQGVVFGERGQRLSGVEVRVVDAAPVVKSDERGEFSLSGLPAGTHELEVRRLGYPIERYPVDLRGGRTLRREVRLQNVVSLEAMNVIGRRAKYASFEANRRLSQTGLFMSETEIAARHAVNTSDLLTRLPGFRILGSGAGAKVVSTRGQCSPKIVIENLHNQEINTIPPSLIGAIEIYPNSNQAPIQYRSTCGLILIWTKR